MPLTVISYLAFGKTDITATWPSSAGRRLLNGVPHTIIGVAPKVSMEPFVGWSIQFWVPVSMEEIFEPEGTTSSRDRERPLDRRVCALLKAGRDISSRHRKNIGRSETAGKGYLQATNRGHEVN